MLPSIKELVVGISGDESDDVADALQEMHGHMETGNYKGAAEALRCAHRMIATEHAQKSAGGDGADSLYDY